MSSENYEKLRLQIRGIEGRVARIEEHLGFVAPAPTPPIVAGAELRTPREVESSRNPNKPTVTKQTHGVAHTMTVRRVGAPVVTKAAAPPAAAPPPATVVPSSSGPQVTPGVADQLLGMLEGLAGVLQVLRVPTREEPPPAADVAPVQQPSSSEAGELDWLSQEPDVPSAPQEPTAEQLASVQG